MGQVVEASALRNLGTTFWENPGKFGTEFEKIQARDLIHPARERPRPLGLRNVQKSRLLRVKGF